MTVSTFKKKDPPNEPPVPIGTVVFLNSDTDGEVPMTAGEFKNGQILCRWHDDVGNLQGDWFSPGELNLGEEIVDEIVFTPEISP